ncbi:Membrane-associated guanylate kinase, WW and PDZ domain-containing protein 2, partial [Stegodyphus mimosarum]
MFHSPSFSNGHSRMNGKANGSYRSKTPTAELYSSRDKEPVMIARPKTPLVDTRNWPIPSSDFQSSNMNPKLLQESSSNLGSTVYNHRPVDYNHSNDLLECSPERHGNPSWYSDQGRGRDWHNHNYRDSSHVKENAEDNFNKVFVNSSVPDNAHQNFTSGHVPRNSLDPMKRFPVENKFHFNNSEPWRDVHRHDTNANNSVFQPVSVANGNSSSGTFDSSLYNINDEKFANASNSFVYGQQFYKSHVPTYHLQHMPNTNMGSIYASSHQEVSQYNENMYSRNMQNHYPHSVPLNPTTKMDLSMHRKHGTSFEHEQPMPYLSSDLRNMSQSSVPKVQEGKNGAVNYIDMTVTLQRQESGFGFRIVGGTEEGSQVAIGHIVPGGAADLDGNLKSGDEILGVDGQRVVNTSHHHVVQLMSTAAENGKVTLHLRRPVISTESSSNSKHIETLVPYDVTVTRNANEGFGFVIISSVNKSGSTIGRIIEGSPAERCGQLHVGDTIIAVNGVSIINMHHGDIVNFIKDCGYSVTLTIG